MLGMGKLSYHYKIPGRSIPSVHSRFQDALVQHQRARKILYNGSKISGEAFTNAVMLYFLDLERAAQEKILDEYVSRFEAQVKAEPDSPLDEEPQTEATRTKVQPRKSSRSRKGAG